VAVLRVVDEIAASFRRSSGRDASAPPPAGTGGDGDGDGGAHNSEAR
jgi:hypothetical protein